MLCHDSCSSAQYDPCEQRTDDCVSDTDPCGSNTVFPTELSCVSDEYNSREIRCSVTESREPGAGGPAAQNESLNAVCLLTGHYTDDDHHCEEYDQEDDLDC